MAKFFQVLAVLTITVGVLAAQDAPTLSQHFKPGDPIHYFVQFDGNPELTSLSLDFTLISGPKKDQAGFNTGFPISQLKSVSPGVFEVNGVIPVDAATGTFTLNRVVARHSPAARVYNQNDFQKVTIEVVNDAGYDFPPLKSITPNPPQ